MMRRISWLAACAVITVSCSSGDPDSHGDDMKSDVSRATSELEPLDFPGIDKIQAVSGVYLASQPDESGFKAVKARGIKTVIDLRHADETEFDEKKIVEGLGMTYVHLPWNGTGELTDEVFDQTREMLESAEKPVLLHCKSANRAGAVWLPFRVLEEGIAVEDAVDEAKAVGLKSTGYEEKAREYIKRKSS